MRRAYSALFACALPLLLVRLWWLGIVNPAYRLRWRERLGWYAHPRPAVRPIWIHAVSVGEVNAAAPLIKALRERDRDIPILLTTTTPTGYDTVARLFGQGVQHAYFPYDFSPIVVRFLNYFTPRLLLLMETELWPNVIHACGARRVPVCLINGRLSSKSARQYALIRPLVQPMLAGLWHAAMQSDTDALRLIGIGARPEAVSVTGSLKFDIYIPPSVYEEAAALRRNLGQDRPIFMAGSTRPREEDALIEIYAELKERFPNLLMVLAPRHPERFAEVAALCEVRGLKMQRRSSGTECVPSIEILLLDSMGELVRFYAASDVAFVGGSIAPLGGHNVLEPAGLGVPIVTGPHLFNFAEIAAKLIAGGSLKVANTSSEIVEITSSWLSSSDTRDLAGRTGREIVEANRGATMRILAVLDATL